MGITVKIWDVNTTLVVLEMGWPREICPISNTTPMVFIPSFNATHAITYIQSIKFDGKNY